jgi:hypothetical protein
VPIDVWISILVKFFISPILDPPVEICTGVYVAGMARQEAQQKFQLFHMRTLKNQEPYLDTSVDTCLYPCSYAAQTWFAPKNLQNYLMKYVCDN